MKDARPDVRLHPSPPKQVVAPLSLPARIYTTKNQMDDMHAPDMRCKDRTETVLRDFYRLTDVSSRCNPYTMADRKRSAAILFDELRDLTDAFSHRGPYQDLMRKLISHMQGNSGTKFSDPLLDRAMSERIDLTTETETLEEIKATLVEHIDWESGCYPLHLKHKFTEAIRRTTLPKFKSVADFTNGLGITMHDIWATHITLQSLTVSGNRFSAQVHFRSQDHFGLDDTDVRHWIYSNVRLFRIWFVLQRWVEYGYRPFITEMNVTKTIEGSRKDGA